MMDTQEQQWIDRAKGGDQEAFAQLVCRYEKRVLALTCRMCRSPEDGAEAAQEAFLAAWQGLPFFRGDASFSTWLYRLASNAAVDLLRRESRRAAVTGPSLDDGDLELPDRSASPQEEAERREARAQIEAGLQALTVEHRQVLVLRELHQLSYEEIAEVLDLDVGTVKSRISRGRRQLRNFLLKSGNFFPPPSSKETGKEG
jgi:RNA polymerase sigma-70 factor (ECF subfamily)